MTVYSLYIVTEYSLYIVTDYSVTLDSVKCDSVEQSATVCRYRPDVTSFPVDCPIRPPRPPRPSSFALNTAYTAGDTSLYCTVHCSRLIAALHAIPLHCTGKEYATLYRGLSKGHNRSGGSEVPPYSALLPIVHYSL